MISRMDMPTPGRARRSRCACSRTSSGRIAGPAEKLKILVVVTISPPLRKSYDLQVENVAVVDPDAFAQGSGRRAIQVDPGDGGLCPFKHDVFCLLHVEIAAAQVVEHVRKHAGPVAVAHD